jgi:quercetin dioxygenase-like cupin family protein
VLFENDRVRLLEARLKPGDSSALHSHPDYLIYNLEDGRVRFSGPSSEGKEVELNAGGVMWRDAEEHSAEGVGSTDVACTAVRVEVAGYPALERFPFA